MDSPPPSSSRLPPGPPAAPPPTFGIPSGPYPYAPLPQKSNMVLIVVIVVVIVIGLVAALAAAVYFMTAGLITNPGPTRPLVTFSTVYQVNAQTWQFTIASASPAVAPSNYRVNFQVGTFVGGPRDLGRSGLNATVVVPTSPPTNVNVIWTDLGGEGTLNAGDYITIGLSSVPSSGTPLTFYLLYSDGSTIQTRTWQA